jgi:hypothetical protein
MIGGSIMSVTIPSTTLSPSVQLWPESGILRVQADPAPVHIMVAVSTGWHHDAVSLSHWEGRLGPISRLSCHIQGIAGAGAGQLFNDPRGCGWHCLHTGATGR